MRRASTLAIVTACLWSVGLRAAAQTTAPATQPTTETFTPVLARVIEVRGDVQHRTLDQKEWRPCREGDEYPQETVIRTGLRSSIKLQLGDEEPYSAIVIESASKSVLSELVKNTETKRVRIGLGYGRIRGGVAEGGLKSDFTIDSPVATLSKRGTWNFGMYYERGTDRFEIFLLERGLVEALDQVTRQRRRLAPGQAVTNAMRRWLDEAQIRRNVPIADLFGQGDIEVAFNRLRSDGLGVSDPAGGRPRLIDLSDHFAREQFRRLLLTRVQPIPPGGLFEETKLRPEGFFGTGRGDQLIPVIIEAGSPLAQKGYARPGRYLFRRAALVEWLRSSEARP